MSENTDSGLSNHLRPWINWRRKRFWLLAFVVLYTLLGFFAVPRFIESMLTKTIEATGRAVDIERIRVNPYVLSARINGLDIRDPDNTSILKFDEFLVNLQTSSLFNWAWTLAEVRLAGMHIEEERFGLEDTRWTRFINDLSGPEEQQQADSEEQLPPRVVIHNLVLEDGSTGITDQLVEGYHVQFGPVSVSANDLRTIPGHSGQKSVTIGTPSGGVISWRGDLGFSPVSSTGTFSVRGKVLPATLEYADHLLPIGIAGEEIEMDFKYSLQFDEAGLRFIASEIKSRTGEIAIRMDNEDEPFLTLAEIAVNGGLVRYPDREATAESLTIKGLDVSARLEQDGHLSLLDALPRESEEPGIDKIDDQPGSPPFSVRLAQISLPDASLEFEDQSIEPAGRIVIEDMDLVLKGVDNAPQTAIGTELDLRLQSGGAVSYKGNVVALPEFALEGRAAINDVSLDAFQPWLQQIANVELQAGSAAIEFDVSGTPDSLKMVGKTTVAGLELLDTLRDQRLAGFETLTIEQFDIDQSAMTLQTSPVSITGAFGRIHIFEDLTTNIDGLMVEPKEAETTGNANATEADEPGMNFTIGGIEILDSTMDFSDDSLPLPFRTLISDLDGNLSILSTNTAEPTRVEMEGQVDEFGEARISGELNPWDFTEASDIAMIFRNLEMSNLTPYTVQYAGYAINAGSLDLDLGYVIQNSQLAGENNIVIRELTLGDKVEDPDAASLPLKLAVALLKDSEGVIDLDLPVSGNLDDPTFKISGIVWKAIGNLITRIVTSPFRFLGNLVGFDSEDFGTLQFQPGSSEISPPDREQLLKLAEAMQKRPQLGLVITGVYAEALDRPALQALLLQAKLDETEAALLETGEAETLNAERPALEALFIQAFPETGLELLQSEFTSAASESEEPVLDEPAYMASLRSRLREAQEIGTGDLEVLASERAAAISGVLSDNSGDQSLNVVVSDQVASSESDSDQVPLELEVSVGNTIEAGTEN